MRPYRFNKIFPVLYKKSLLTQCLYIFYKIISRNVFNSRATGIKYLAHPYLILWTQCSSDLFYKIIA